MNHFNLVRPGASFSHTNQAHRFADVCGALETGELLKSAAARTRVLAKAGTQNFCKDWVSEARTAMMPADRAPYAAAALVGTERSLMKASKAGFTVSAWVVHIPCGKPL